MGVVKRSAATVAVLLAAGLAFFIHKALEVPEVPKINLKYWGPGQQKPDDKSIKPFKIDFPQSELEGMRRKMEKVSLAPPLESVAFEYGFNTNYLKDVLDFWKTKYNWTERVNYLNKFPHFHTEIGGLNVHFIHVKPDTDKIKGKQVLPLLLVHGWPGSVREFYEIIPMLTTPREDADFVFEVIAPSLPGYIFSQAPSKPGLGPAHIGVIFNELMARLGHSKYYYQGGDWGSVIGHTMSVLFPKNVMAYHSNFCNPQTSKARILSLFAYFFPKLFIEESRQEQFVSQFVDVYISETGYFHIQATKPDTLGVALTDSPVGLMAYLLEKFSIGTDLKGKYLPDGGLEKLNKIYIIDNYMLYWLTKSITSSMRLYKEVFSSEYQTLGVEKNPNFVPTACAWFKNEMLYFPKMVLESIHKNLVQVNHFPIGGHFAALEVPELLSEDLWKFVIKLRKLKDNNSKNMT